MYARTDFRLRVCGVNMPEMRTNHGDVQQQKRRGSRMRAKEAKVEREGGKSKLRLGFAGGASAGWSFSFSVGSVR